MNAAARNVVRRRKMAPVEADVCDFTVYPVWMSQMFSNHIGALSQATSARPTRSSAA